MAPPSRILIVGGTSGIGEAVARLAMNAGMNVVTASRQFVRGGDQPGRSHLVLDVSNEVQATEVLSTCGPFDHLVVTAGGALPASFRGKGTASAMQAFDTKFWGAWRVAALTPLNANASITFVSGVFAERPAAGQAAATCVNAALEGLARALAVELAPIRVNAVSPGLVDTPMWHSMPEQRRSAYFESVAEKLPARRICLAEDVAALIMACIANPVLTGTVLKIDGGYTLV